MNASQQARARQIREHLNNASAALDELIAELLGETDLPCDQWDPASGWDYCAARRKVADALRHFQYHIDNEERADAH